MHEETSPPALGRRNAWEFFVLLKRDFFGLFGAIWLVAGVMFLVIGTGIAVRDGTWAQIVAGLIITAVGGTILQRALQRIRLEDHLRREGLTAEAEVIGVDQTGMRYNKRWQWKVVYEYVDRAGARQHGSSGYLDPDEAAEWQVGDKGMIRIDPARPERSIWIGRPEDV